MLAFVHSNLHAENPSKPTIVLHKSVYRTDYGYSLSRVAVTTTSNAMPTHSSSAAATAASGPLTAHHNSHLDAGFEVNFADHHSRHGGTETSKRKYSSRNALSLQALVCWKLLAYPDKVEQLRQTYPEPVVKLFDEIKSLAMLWQIQCVPRRDAPASFASSAFPTLAQFALHNKSFLSRPVNRTLHQTSTSLSNSSGSASPLTQSSDSTTPRCPSSTAAAPLIHPQVRRTSGSHPGFLSPATTPPPPDIWFSPCTVPHK